MPNLISIAHRSEIISFLGPQIGCIVPLELKKLTSADIFNKSIKTCNDIFQIKDKLARNIT